MHNISAICITLDINKKERAQRAIKEISKLGFKKVNFFEGVNGNKLTESKLKKLLSPRSYYELKNGRYVHEGLSSPGAIGCYLAHIKAWEKCLESGENLAIFEDDFVAIPGSKKNMANVLREAISHGYDILRFQHRKTPGLGDNIENISGYNLIAKVKRTEGGTAYIITPKAAEKLLSTSFPISVQVDSYIDIGAYYHNLLNLTSKENFFDDPRLESDIGHNSIELYKDGWDKITFRRHNKCILVMIFIVVILIFLYFQKNTI